VSLRKPMEVSRPGGAVVAKDEPAHRGPRAWGLVAVGVGLGVVLVAGALVLRMASRARENAEQSVSELPQQSERAADQSPARPAESSTEKADRIPDRPVGRSTIAAQPQPKTVQSPTVSTEPVIKLATDSAVRAVRAVRTDTAIVATRPQGDLQAKVGVAPPPPTPSVTATAADARAVASEFLTWCNHRQWQDVERLPSLEGAPELRTELIRLVRSAPDFQAGFERLASRPVLADRTFTTDFVLDLEWRGGQRQLRVTVSAELSNGSWHLAGFGVHSPD
jgi:hypothetical protein